MTKDLSKYGQVVSPVSKRLDRILFDRLRGRMKKELGFDVDMWNRGDLKKEKDSVTLVKDGRPYDLVRSGVDIELKDGITRRTLAEIKGATDPERVKDFTEKVEAEMKKQASMIRPVTERLKFTARLILAAFDPSLATALKELLEEMKKKDPEAAREAEKMLVRNPATGKYVKPSVLD